MTEYLPRHILAIFVATIIICLFWGLSHYGLLHNNDGLYAEIAVEMINRGDYIVPYLNGMPYLEKPPLLYWLIAGSFKIFGVHEWSARIVTASCGLLVIVASYLSTEKIFSKRTAAWSALIMGTSIGFAIISRIVFFEMLLVLLLSVTLFSYVHWHSTGQRKFLRSCYIAMALAVLAKGFITLILAGLVIVTFNIIIKRPVKLWLQDFDSLGLCLFIVIMLPWHIAMINKDPHFAWFYFINEHILRFLGQRQPKDYYEGPFYYYTYRLVAYLFPWSLFLSIFCLRLPKQASLAISNSERQYKIFLIIWFLVIFVFFSVSRAKANYYMITAVPPLVILLSNRLERMINYEAKIVLFLLQFFTLFFAALACVVLSIKFNLIPIQYDHLINTTLQITFDQFDELLLYGFVLLGLISLGLRCYRPCHIMYHFPLLGATSALLIITAVHIAPQFETIFSSRKIVSTVHLTAGTTCYFRDYERFSSFVFYLGAPIAIIDSQSNDLLYGQQHSIRTDLFLASSSHLPAILQRCHTIIVAHDKLRPFQQQYTNYRAIFNNTKLSIFVQQN